MTDDLTIPDFLDRRKTKAKKVVAPKGAAPVAAADPDAALNEERLARLTPKARVLFEEAMSTGKARPAWLDDASIVQHWNDKVAIVEKKKAERKEKLELVRAKHPRVPKRASREGLVSIGEVAKELGLIPREARAVLRAIKMVKPACGWAWKKEDVAGVKKAIEDGRKTMAGGKKGGKKGGGKRKLVIPPAGEDTDWSLSKKEKKSWHKKTKERDAAEAERLALLEDSKASATSTKSKAAQQRLKKAAAASSSGRKTPSKSKKPSKA